MKRYSKDPYFRCCMAPSSLGKWVMFDDIKPPAGWEDDLDATLRARLLAPQRQPLTDEEIDALAMDSDGLPNSHLELARAIEKAHGIGA